MSPTSILTLDAIGSTNAEAMRLGLSGTSVPFWLRADRQTAGRGRSGRPWVSEPGNLYASHLLRLACEPTVLHHLSFVAAVATVAAIRRVAADRNTLGLATNATAAPSPLVGERWGGGASGTTTANQKPPTPSPSPQGGGESHRVLDQNLAYKPAPPVERPTPRLKWPNDILIDGAKLAGILPESTLLPGGGALAVIGIGINLAWAPVGLDRPVACLAAHGIDITPQAMLEALATEMSAALALWDNSNGFPAIRAKWLTDAGPLGVPLSVHAGRDIFSGTFQGLEHDGALILRDHSGYDQRMTFGDVTMDAAAGGEGTA